MRSLITHKSWLLPLIVVSIVSASGCGGAESLRARHFEKGQKYLADGNFEKARVEFANTLQIAPKDAEARYEMGVVDEKLGNQREAAQFYTGTIEVAPQHVGARANLGRMYLFAAMPDKALETIAPVMSAHPDDARLLTVRAAAEAQKKEPDAALADAERAVKIDPNDANAVSVLAGIYSSQGHADQAMSLLERTVQSTPNAADLRLVLAQLYVQSHRTADAEGQLIEIVKLRPKDKAARIRLAQFYTSNGKPEAAESTLRQAVKELPNEHDLKFALVGLIASHAGRDVAERELKSMIAAAPSDDELRFGLARFYVEGKEPAKAEGVYEEVIKRDGTNPQGLVARDRLALLHLQRSDVPGALALVKQVLDTSPRDDDALELRGSIALANQDPRSAIADLRAVLRDQPNALGVLRNLARAHLANGEPAVAEVTLRHAVESNPTSVPAKLDFVRLLLQLGKAERAKQLVDQMVKDNPQDATALDLEFQVSMATHDLAAAHAAADALVASQPKQAVGYMFQGMIADSDHKPEEALKAYREAAAVQPDALEPLEAIVREQMAAKRLPDALKTLDDYDAHHPDKPFALNLKGNLLAGATRYPEAADAFKQAIARNPRWWVPYRGLAYTQLAQKNPDAAVATMRDAKSVVDERAALGEEFAILLERLGREDDAIHEYEDVIKAHPQSDVAANNLAMLLANTKSDAASLDRAKQLASRFADSTNPSYLDTYGWVLYKRGNAKDSVPVLERVVAKVPEAPMARYHLGMAQASAGDNDDARSNLKRAVDSGTHFDGLDEARATLDKVGKSPASPTTPKT